MSLQRKRPKMAAFCRQPISGGESNLAAALGWNRSRAAVIAVGNFLSRFHRKSAFSLDSGPLAPSLCLATGAV
jgi:hypothetical protein